MYLTIIQSKIFAMYIAKGPYYGVEINVAHIEIIVLAYEILWLQVQLRP